MNINYQMDNKQTLFSIALQVVCVLYITYYVNLLLLLADIYADINISVNIS